MDELLINLKALADETRFKIIDLLLTHDFCVGALAARLGISEAAVSQQLQVLRKAGLVKGEKRGYWTHYSVEQDVLKQVAASLKKVAERSSGCRHACQRELSGVKDHTSEGREKKVCKCGCEHPEKLESEPGKCTPEKIKECHGENKEHPCEREDNCC